MDTLAKVLEYVQTTHAAYTNRPIDTTISPHDDMINLNSPAGMTHFLSAGVNALENIFQAMVLCSRTKLATVLDMPCGFGRVTRHLAVAFPDVHLYACDLYQDRIDFCAEHFGARPIKSKEQFSDLTFETGSYLIWVGSLLTHLPEDLFGDALALVSRSLNPGGIGLVTFHGRHTPFIQHHRWRYLADDMFAPAEIEFRVHGFGYADYNLPALNPEQSADGVSLSSPDYVLRLLAQDDSIRIRGYSERGWDGHQDVAIFQKYPING